MPLARPFADHIASRLGQFAGAMRVGLARRRPIPAEASSTTVTDLAQQIRTCAAQAATHRVHLFLRVPFPIAVQLGRALNTLEVTPYEWDDSAATPRYIQAVTVASGRGGGPILARRLPTLSKRSGPCNDPREHLADAEHSK